jgi:[acyl-carrier-protein] S-malonyltransferase
MSTALLFPGQGSQSPQMRDAVERARPDLLAQAIELTGGDPFASLERGTRFLQPALYCASIALWEEAGRPRGDLYAGHSLGEIAALVAAGSIDAADGLRLATRRGELMQAAAEEQPEGAMLAILGADELARELAAAHGVAVANENAPGQTVISGAADAIEAARAEAKEHGARAARLAVRGAFHSQAMALAVAPLRATLAEIVVRAPRAPVISGVTGEPMDDVRARLAEALVRPVRWTNVLATLRRLGAERFVEVGPGKVLIGLVRRTLPDVEALTLERLEAVHA